MIFRVPTGGVVERPARSAVDEVTLFAAGALVREGSSGAMIVVIATWNALLNWSERGVMERGRAWGRQAEKVWNLRVYLNCVLAGIGLSGCGSAVVEAEAGGACHAGAKARLVAAVMTGVVAGMLLVCNVLLCSLRYGKGSSEAKVGVRRMAKAMAE
jgi:hypothetical protein